VNFGCGINAMKRDMELIRKILIAIEDHPNPQGFVPLHFDGYSDNDVSYQIKLLADHGLIEASNCSSMRDFCWRAKRLSWDGHDFIEAIRDDTRWNKAKNWVVEAGKTVTIETLKLAVKALFQ
jgi:hypothetical protein